MPMAYPSAQRCWRWSDVKKYVTQRGWGGEERTTSFQSAYYTLLTVHVRAWMELPRRTYQTREGSVPSRRPGLLHRQPKRMTARTLATEWDILEYQRSISPPRWWDQCSRPFPSGPWNCWTDSMQNQIKTQGLGTQRMLSGLMRSQEPVVGRTLCSSRFFHACALKSLCYCDECQVSLNLV